MAKKKSTKKKSKRKSSAVRKPPQRVVDRAGRIYEMMEEMYPDAHCALDHEDAWQLIIATILSAQCTDERVNMVTPHLFKAYPGPQDLAEAEQADVEKIIHSTGFYRNKAKSIIATSKDIMEKHDGEVPADMDQLLKLRGVARKTANVVLGNAYDINHGVVVDTHVGRLSRRMGFTKYEDPVKVEQVLMKTFPQDDWTMLSHLMIWHGRAVCDARKPNCAECRIHQECPKNGVE